jgi:hypothetical protein
LYGTGIWIHQKDQKYLGSFKMWRWWRKEKIKDQLDRSSEKWESIIRNKKNSTCHQKKVG